MLQKASIALVLAAVVVSGCNRSSNALSGVSTQRPPQALPSVPSGNVQSSQLDPLGQPQQLGGVQPNPNDPTVAQSPTTLNDATQNTEVAAIAPAQQQVSTEPLTHDSLAGSWNVSTDSASCRAILAFTQWSGGYRGTTVKCNSPELSTMAAWDIKSNKVVLVDANGSQVATLSKVGATRYSGQTSSGQPVTFSR